MTDPFVQRMMARSQARRQNKENASLTDGTRSRLKQINSMYSDDAPQPLSPSKTSTSNVNLPQVSSPSKSRASPVKDPPCPSPSNSDASLSPRRRMNALVRRTEQLNNWEDDYSYHSMHHKSQTEVDSRKVSSPSHQVPSETRNLHANNSDSVKSLRASPGKTGEGSIAKTNSSLNSMVMNVPSLDSAIESTKPGYYFGESPSVGSSNGGGRFVGSSDSSVSYKIPSSNSAASCACSSSSFNASCPHTVKSPYKSVDTKKKCPLVHSEGRLLPTKPLDWDQRMINSLEAQGFTPTRSQSRLYYDFKKDREIKPEEEEDLHPPASPSKVNGMSLAEFMRNNGSPTKVTSPLKERKSPSKASVSHSPAKHVSGGVAPTPPPPPPVILTCHPKSPASSPVRTLTRVPSPEPKPKNNTRDTSPSKVGEMRSRWEQHIRDASPEPKDRSRSPVKQRPRPSSPVKSFVPQSPVKSFGSQSSSHIRAGSPVKSFGSQSSSHIRAGSPIKSSPAKSESQSSLRYQGHRGMEREGASLRDLSPSKDQGQWTSAEREQRPRRNLSPHKPPPASEIVKGEAPMQDTIPLVEEAYRSSVRARAAAFDMAGAKLSPEKDPAERSVQERRALFSKKKDGALVPKAPFGQAVPLKNLQKGSGNTHSEMATKTSVAHSHPVSKPTKKVATEPAPVISQRVQQFQRGRSPSPSKGDAASVGAQRMHFENIQDNWRGNEINNKIQTERQKEMDLLLNRFRRPNSSVRSPERKQSEPRYPVESETEYVESDESFADSTTSDDTLRAGARGPPKPPRLYLEGASSRSPDRSPPCPPPPPPPHQQHLYDISPVHQAGSPPARFNSTEIGEVYTSPKAKKEFVPKIKPGCLFPSLSDIESHSEAVDSQDEEVQDSSFAESILTCTSIESFGQKIKHMVQTDQAKSLSAIEEQTERSENGYSISDSTMEAIDAIDNAIDEALDDEPTPPKRQRTYDYEAQSASVFKTPKINPGSPRNQDTDDQGSLAHSISMYRKQKPDINCTPVRQITRHPDICSPTPDTPESPSVTVSARIRELQMEVAEQQRVISQASNAVTVVLQHIEHQGTPQHVEAEKLLLLATQKRQTALDEIQRLKTEGALSQHSWAVTEDTCRGSISISKISVPLKKDFIEKRMNGDEVYHLIVLVKHREQVISSQLLATPSCVIEGSITFPNLMALHNLASDFIISLEVYALRTSRLHNFTIKKEQSRMKLTPLKRLQKSESRMASPSIQSPGGPYAVRSSSFQLVGFTHLNIATLTRNAWTLEKVPYTSPLDGHLLMRVSCSFEGGITERGFLTMFEDIGGFGAWNRRWCVLSGMFLRYWRYPDDEMKKEPNGQIDLRSCTTRRVELVSRDVCARQHTFQLTLLRPAYSGDVSNLVQEVNGQSVITRHLLSADSKEERIAWCSKLNKSLANIRAWDPDALRPEDYHV